MKRKFRGKLLLLSTLSLFSSNIHAIDSAELSKPNSSSSFSSSDTLHTSEQFEENEKNNSRNYLKHKKKMQLNIPDRFAPPKNPAEGPSMPGWMKTSLKVIGYGLGAGLSIAAIRAIPWGVKKAYHWIEEHNLLRPDWFRTMTVIENSRKNGMVLQGVRNNVQFCAINLYNLKNDTGTPELKLSLKKADCDMHMIYLVPSVLNPSILSLKVNLEENMSNGSLCIICPEQTTLSLELTGEEQHLKTLRVSGGPVNLINATGWAKKKGVVEHILLDVNKECSGVQKTPDGVISLAGKTKSYKALLEDVFSKDNVEKMWFGPYHIHNKP